MAKYHQVERWLLQHGRWAILAALGLVVGISVVFAIAVYRGKWAVPAAGWLAWVLFP